MLRVDGVVVEQLILYYQYLQQVDLFKVMLRLLLFKVNILIFHTLLQFLHQQLCILYQARHLWRLQ